MPINDLVLPCDVVKVDIRGVDIRGNGTGVLTLDVSVIVDGVWVIKDGDGGKTKRVCEGAAEKGTAS